MTDRDREINNIWCQLSREEKDSFLVNFGGMAKRAECSIYEDNFHRSPLKKGSFHSFKQDREAEFILRCLKMWRDVGKCEPERRMPRPLAADKVLLWFMLPDDAEDLAGWLYEEQTKVAERQTPRFAKIWLYWALVWVIANHLLSRTRERTILGRLFCALVRRIER